MWVCDYFVVETPLRNVKIVVTIFIEQYKLYGFLVFYYFFGLFWHDKNNVGIIIP